MSQEQEQSNDFDSIMDEIKIGNLMRVRELLSQTGLSKAKILYACDQAATYGQIEVLRELLPLYEDEEVIKKERDRWMPICFFAVVEKGHLELVKELLPEVHDCDGDALRVAAANGHLDIVRELATHDHKSHYPLYDHNIYYEALVGATHGGYIEVVKTLLRESLHGESPALVMAARDGHIEFVRELIDEGASVDYREFHGIRGNNALEYAVKNGHLEIVRELIPLLHHRENVSSYFAELLEYGAEHGHLEVVREFLPLLDAEDKDDNSVALNLAVSNGHLEVVRELIPHSDPKENDSYSLWEAAKAKHNEVVKELLPHSDISNWSEERWEFINPEMKHFIESYYERQALNQAIPTIQAPQQAQVITQSRSRGRL